MTSSLKTWWQGLKYWQKGGIIGALGYFVYVIVFYLVAPLCGWDCYTLWALTLIVPELLKNSIIFPYIDVLSSLVYDILDFIVFTLIASLQGLLVGALIGLIIGKVKGKYHP